MQSKDSDIILSLKKYCDPCGATCCRHGEAYGAPIISEPEKESISRFYREKYGKDADLFERIVIGTEHYYIVKEIDGRCYSLDEQFNDCTIQQAKPLDCLIYPLKAIYQGNEKVLVIDTQCPASPHLTSEWIERASILAMISIGMFSQKAFQHWMDHNISWVQPGRARRLEEWLRER